MQVSCRAAGVDENSHSMQVNCHRCWAGRGTTLPRDITKIGPQNGPLYTDYNTAAATSHTERSDGLLYSVVSRGLSRRMFIQTYYDNAILEKG